MSLMLSRHEIWYYRKVNVWDCFYVGMGAVQLLET